MAGNDHSNSSESRRILDRIAKETDPSGSLAARTAGRLRDHVKAADADQSDKVEVWGTRIGRVLGLALMVVLLYWLYGYFAAA